VRFSCEVTPAEAWGRDALFWVDNVLPMGLVAETLHDHPGHLLISVPLAAGRRKLSWVWQYREGSASEAAGFRLLNVSVEHAMGAGAARCERCTEGTEVSMDGTSCRKCTAGTATSPSEDGGAFAEEGCQPCPPGSFAPAAGSQSCLMCGHGLWSERGSSSCTAAPVVEKSDPAPEPLTFNMTALVAAWRYSLGEAAFGRGVLEVAGQQYIIGLLEAVPEPGQEGGELSHVWELHGDSREGIPGIGQGACDNVDVGNSVSMPSDPQRLGSRIAAVEAVSLPGLRGVRVQYEGEEPCPGMSGKRGASLFFRCDATVDYMYAMPPVAARDERGIYHLEGLRFVASAPFAALLATSLPPGTCADDAALAWPTPLACPPCRKVDWAEHPGECGADGMREVTFVLVGPCLGGPDRPAARREVCGGAVGVVTEAEIEGMLKVLVVFAIVIGLALIIYAAYLHRKYHARYAGAGNAALRYGR